MNVHDNIKMIPELIIIPRREVVRAGNRWIIYLPQDYNELWKSLKESRKKVRVYIEVLD